MQETLLFNGEELLETIGELFVVTAHFTFLVCTFSPKHVNHPKLIATEDPSLNIFSEFSSIFQLTFELFVLFLCISQGIRDVSQQFSHEPKKTAGEFCVFHFVPLPHVMAGGRLKKKIIRPRWAFQL